MSANDSRNHRVWRFGAEIDTDVLASGTWMQFGMDEIARHCLEAVRPEFAGTVRPGDVIVAGRDFGIGSSREQAAAVLRHLGIAAVIAPSYAGLYFRNAANVGLLLLTCPDAERIQEGECIGFDARAGAIHRETETLACKPIPAFLLDMVEAGGLLPTLEQQFRKSDRAVG